MQHISIWQHWADFPLPMGHLMLSLLALDAAEVSWDSAGIGGPFDFAHFFPRRCKLVSDLKVIKLPCGYSFNFSRMYKCSLLGLLSNQIFWIWAHCLRMSEPLVLRFFCMYGMSAYAFWITHRCCASACVPVCTFSVSQNGMNFCWSLVYIFSYPFHTSDI